MRASTKQFAAVLIATSLVSPTIGAADEEQGEIADKFVCATQLLLSCKVDGSCEPVSHEAVNAPSLLYVYLADNVIAGREADGYLRTSEISNFTRFGSELILQGSDAGHEDRVGAVGWTMSIDPESGHMSMSVAAEGVVFAVFGVCDAPPFELSSP